MDWLRANPTLRVSSGSVVRVISMKRFSSITADSSTAPLPPGNASDFRSGLHRRLTPV